jgi:hypothetical protein
MAFVFLQRPFLANKCHGRSLPLTSLHCQQHRRIAAAVSFTNNNCKCLATLATGFPETSPYEIELLIVERQRDQLDNLLEVYDREELLKCGYTKSGINYERRFLNNFEGVIHFYYREGRVPKRQTKGEEGRLANWMNDQRKAKSYLEQGKPSTNVMNPERIKLLESMSWWDWNPLETAYQSNFEELKAYVEKYGEIPPVRHPTLGR